MLKRGINIYTNLSHKAHLLNHIHKRTAVYEAQRGNYMQASHEEASKNPLLPKKNGRAFQHPCFCRGQCSLPNCIHKVCVTPCSDIVERTTIGHGTHDGTFPGTIFLSDTDLNGENRPQYAKMYEDPINNPDALGEKIDPKLTAGINSNTEMRDNLHMNASRNPCPKSDNGSDDINNIN